MTRRSHVYSLVERNRPKSTRSRVLTKAAGLYNLPPGEAT